MALPRSPSVGADPSSSEGRSSGLSLLGREIVGITVLTFLVVTTTTLFHVAHLRHALIGDMLHETTLIAQQVYAQSALALIQRPADPPLTTLRTDPGLRRLIDA